MKRKHGEQTPLQLLKVGKRFVGKAAERLEPNDATRLRLADIATELAFIAGALERRAGGA